MSKRVPFLKNGGEASKSRSQEASLDQPQITISSSPKPSLPPPTHVEPPRTDHSPRKWAAGDGSRTEDDGSKRPRVATPTILNNVGDNFGRLAQNMVAEADMAAWSKKSLEESNAAATRAVAQLFHHQLSFHKDIKHLSSQNRKFSNAAITTQFKEQQTKDEAVRNEAKMKQAHREEVKVLNDEIHELKAAVSSANHAHADEIKALRDRILEVQGHSADEIKALSDQLQVAQARSAELEKMATVAPSPTPNQLEEAEAKGSVNFMKSFMEHLPQFYWLQLGQETADFAAELRAEIEAEARAHATRIAEEEQGKRAEAEKGQDVDGEPTIGAT